jgi:spermidine synthase
MPLEHLTFPIRGDKLSVTTQVERVLCDYESQFQRIEIIETPSLGKMLLLDRHVQLATLDEAAYHESLVHIPLMGLDHPTRALVIGGGDGGVLRELCRFPTIEHVDMVEIDTDVVRLCRQFLPELSEGAFEDPRVNLILGDAFAFANSAEGPYDLIVADATDVYEEEDESLSELLFTEPFYRDLLRLLSPQGIVVTQADNVLFCPYSRDEILEQFRSVFPHTGEYWAMVPSFGGYSGFVWGSKGGSPASGWTATAPTTLRYLNPLLLEVANGPLPFQG